MEKKSGCNECVFGESEWGHVNDKYTLLKRTCKRGNTDQLNLWWENNGHKVSTDPHDVMECHEYSESTKCLINMNDKLDKLLILFNDDVQKQE